MEETPSFPPASFPYKEEIPPSALRCGSGQWRMGQATARATGFPGDGVTDSAQEEKRVKMGGQMKIPIFIWENGSGETLQTPQFQALLGGAQSTALLCVLRMSSQKNHCIVHQELAEPLACSHPDGRGLERSQNTLSGRAGVVGQEGPLRSGPVPGRRKQWEHPRGGECLWGHAGVTAQESKSMSGNNVK